MSELFRSPITLLTFALGISGWIVTFVGLCVSHAFTQSASWWVITYESLLISLVCVVFCTNSIKAYYPVVLTLIAISIPYSTTEVIIYISAGRASLIAAASGHIILMFTQFIWIFLFGVQHEASVLRSFSDLNHYYHNRVYSSGNAYQKEYQYSNDPVHHNTIMDLAGLNYPTPIPTQTSYPTSVNQDHMVSVPMYMSPPTQSTVFLSPHSDYSIPVTAIHSYRANKEDPNELSFTKGEILYVHEKRGSWWQAKKSNGTIGMIPSNYVTEQKSG